MASRISLQFIFGPLIILMASFLLSPFAPLTLRAKVLGLGRLFGSIHNIHGYNLRIIPDTMYTEDLHYHAPSHQLFGASEGSEYTRNTWFPPLTNWDKPETIGQGTIIVVNAKTLTATRLILQNFQGPFNTHGIDLWSPSDDSTTVYIAAVNHLPNPEFYAAAPKRAKAATIPQARSRLEIFRHKIGSKEATHLRSIWHPLIRTPNDLYFKSLNEIFVTNDHFYRDGIMRLVEDVAYGTLAPWTDLIHLRIADPLRQTFKADGQIDDTAGVVGVVANKGIHNNNGLGHGSIPTEIMICRTAIGQLLLAEEDKQRPPTLKIRETIQLPCTLDNPSYFADPYAAKTGRDASGYVLAGLAQAAAFPNGLDPVMVWLVQPKAAADPTAKSKSNRGSKWTHRLVFQDNGRTIRTASTAVLVAIDPDENGGRKQGNLFVTGPLGQGIVASRIDL